MSHATGRHTVPVGIGAWVFFQRWGEDLEMKSKSIAPAAAISEIHCAGFDTIRCKSPCGGAHGSQGRAARTHP